MKLFLSNLFKKKLLEFNCKCVKLVSSSYANNSIYIDELEAQIKQKHQVINHLLIPLKNVTCKYQSTVPLAANSDVFQQKYFISPSK